MESVENEPHSYDTISGSEAYPKKPLQCDDKNLQVPFSCLPGEGVEFLGRTTEGIIALSNYRLYLHNKDSVLSIPLGLVEVVECREIFYLHIYCKDARSFRCVFPTNEDCQKWYRRLWTVVSSPKKVEELFAFPFYLYSREEKRDGLWNFSKSERQSSLKKENSLLFQECKHLNFDTSEGGVWRISEINRTFQFCPSYPRYLLVPAVISDQELEAVASFRYSRRIPTVVWRHRVNGTVIARSSQPEVGWLGWRSTEDENLIQAIADTCSFRTKSPLFQNGSVPLENPLKKPSDLDHADISLISSGHNGCEVQPSMGKLLILDARSYAAAVANRAKGGGCECAEYYPNCEVQFVGLANIHSIRKSFQALRALCSSSSDQSNWMSLVEGSKWLLYISGLLKTALIVCNAVDWEQRPVLVHCSDGWDRTPQIVALAELMLDPYYRTIEGFEVLVEKEWLEFGHKFNDRCGHGTGNDDMNERCPVFLQWLDCVHQLLRLYPCSFEFNQQYLVKLAQHTYSCLFGTFLCNNNLEREEQHIAERTFSVWTFLKSNPRFRNYLYTSSDQVLRPHCQVRDLEFWSDVYLQLAVTYPETSSKVEPNVALTPHDSDPITDSNDQCQESNSLLKTKSMDSLFSNAEHSLDRQRRLSDSSLQGLNFDFSQNPATDASGDNLENGDIMCDNLGKDCNHVNPSESDFSDSKNLNDNNCVLNAAPSIDGSTDTLVEEKGQVEVSDLGQCDKSEEEAGGFVESPDNPKRSSPVNTISTSTTDISSSTVYPSDTVVKDCDSEHIRIHPGKCMVCFSKKSGLNGVVMPPKASLSNSVTPGGVCSHYSTPLCSRTPSSGYPATPCDDKLPFDQVSSSRGNLSPAYRLDVDGLTSAVDVMQQQIQELVLNHQAEKEALHDEINRLKLFLSCHCNHSMDKDICSQEISDDIKWALEKRIAFYCMLFPDGFCSLTNRSKVSLADSACSGEQHSNGGQDGSISSDHSWEQVDERDARATLWVPDHAATRCMGCDAEFWMGRRRHHCRNCGKVFCSQCANQMYPVPHEQFYHPVRVCWSCFEMLRTLCKQPFISERLPKPVVTAASN